MKRLMIADGSDIVRKVGKKILSETWLPDLRGRFRP